VGAVSVGVPIAAALLLRRGARLAPILVTLVGIWGCTELATYGDLLAFISAGTAIVAIVAAWMPSAREFGRDMRADAARS
jgi:hypothetical protein